MFWAFSKLAVGRRDPQRPHTVTIKSNDDLLLRPTTNADFCYAIDKLQFSLDQVGVVLKVLQRIVFTAQGKKQAEHITKIVIDHRA